MSVFHTVCYWLPLIPCMLVKHSSPWIGSLLWSVMCVPKQFVANSNMVALTCTLQLLVLDVDAACCVQTGDER